MEQFNWIRPRWTHDKLLAASPFRYDTTPSFYVWLTDNPATRARAGDWVDSGASDPEFQRGSIVKLLAQLTAQTEDEIRNHLLDTYCTDYIRGEEITLNVPKLRIDSPRQALDARILDDYRYRHPYLERRGISEAVQRLMNIGYDRDRNAVTIPWFLADGRLANVMYRKTDSKVFWYAKDGMPIRGLIYGMNIIYSRKIKRAALVEAPIDAMYLMTAGIPAIAVGGASFNESKRDVIVRSTLEEIVIFADHDNAGQAMKRQAVELLAPYMMVRIAGYPMRYKDPNAVGDIAEVRRYADGAKIAKCKSLQIAL